jgi:hypothetical protein
MDILVFKTDIKQEHDLEKLASVLMEEPRINRWTIDNEDIDNVLRIESNQLDPTDVILLIKQSGYCCEELAD